MLKVEDSFSENRISKLVFLNTMIKVVYTQIFAVGLVCR